MAPGGEVDISPGAAEDHGRDGAWEFVVCAIADVVVCELQLACGRSWVCSVLLLVFCVLLVCCLHQGRKLVSLLS